jgi:CheY-like chemotaxis protein
MSRHKRNVMIVDDEPSIRDSVSRILERRGYQVATACGGKEALDMMPVFQPDVVLLDIIMPGLDGYEVCRQLRLITPAVKIIYFTAKVEMDDFKKNVNDDARADAVIEKPASSEKIITCLEQVLAQ